MAPGEISMAVADVAALDSIGDVNMRRARMMVVHIQAVCCNVDSLTDQ